MLIEDRLYFRKYEYKSTKVEVYVWNTLIFSYGSIKSIVVGLISKSKYLYNQLGENKN